MYRPDVHVKEIGQEWVGYDSLVVDTDVIASKRQNGRMVLALRENPFYAEAGGQVSDRGYVEGDGWRMEVEDVARVDDRVFVVGPIEGEFKAGSVHRVGRARGAGGFAGGARPVTLRLHPQRTAERG
jgi:alanyl-tRNA synthetase